MFIFQADAEKVKFAFDIFDFEGKGEIDAFYIGDLLRAVDLNPSEKSVSQFGRPENKGERMINFNDFMPMYQTIKKHKGNGSYVDFVECLKLFDKQEDGTMMWAELEYILSVRGEPIEKEQVKMILDELAPEEDEDGLIPYDSMYYSSYCRKRNGGIKNQNYYLI